jgi:hypothetical protein
LLLAVQTSDPRDPSTKKMAELLVRIFQQTNWRTDPCKQTDRIAYDRAQLELNGGDLRTSVIARLDLAQNLLNAGESAVAVGEMQRVRALLKQRSITLGAGFDEQLASTLAMAYLRMGEQQNCQTNHNAQSCVYPLRGGGVHASREGAEAAVREFTAVLQADPNNLSARWLLNIAYMALGRHPDGVPPRYLIPDSILPAEYDVGGFTDVAAGAGLATMTHAGGSVAEDMDGDGYFDLVVSSSVPGDQLRYFHNDGDGTFSDQTIAAGLQGETGGLNLVHTDYNNDGWPDLLVLRGGWWGKNGEYPISLLRNNGPNAKGQVTFTDVTEEAGLLSFGPTQTAAWADFDNDGLPDLFLGHESTDRNPYACQLFHNNGFERQRAIHVHRYGARNRTRESRIRQGRRVGRFQQ